MIFEQERESMQQGARQRQRDREREREGHRERRREEIREEGTKRENKRVRERTRTSNPVTWYTKNVTTYEIRYTNISSHKTSVTHHSNTHHGKHRTNITQDKYSNTKQPIKPTCKLIRSALLRTVRQHTLLLKVSRRFRIFWFARFDQWSNRAHGYFAFVRIRGAKAVTHSIM